MVVDPVDGERIDVAAGGLQQDQRLLRRRCTSLDRPSNVGEATSGTRRPRMVATLGPADLRRARPLPPLARTISSIAERGMAKIWPPTLTVSAGMMVRVSGTRMVSRDALARPAVDVDDAADPLDIGADHVHADAAAGNGGDLARRSTGRPRRSERVFCARVSFSACSALRSAPAATRLADQRRRRRCRGRRRRSRSGSGCRPGAPRP